MKETDLYQQIARYLGLKHPELDGLWHFDLAGVNNPSPYTRALYGRLNRRAWPDLFIAIPVLQPDSVNVYYGLFLELKREGTQLKRSKDLTKVLKGDLQLRKAGDWWDHHIDEQAIVLDALQGQGFIALFSVGYEATVEIIESYLTGMQAVAA